MGGVISSALEAAGCQKRRDGGGGNVNVSGGDAAGRLLLGAARTTPSGAAGDLFSKNLI